MGLSGQANVCTHCCPYHVFRFLWAQPAEFLGSGSWQQLGIKLSLTWVNNPLQFIDPYRGLQVPCPKRAHYWESA